MSFDASAAVLAAFLAFCRVGSCFLLMPGFSSIRVPVPVRLFVAIAASFAILAHMWDTIVPFVSRRPDALVLLIASELAIGALIGLTARLYLMALQFIGSAMAMMAGYNGMGGSAIDEPEPQAALAALISFAALLLLFVLDFHHEIVKALVASYSVAPMEALFNPRAALVDITDTLSEAFLVMLRLGSPFVAYAILVNLAIGFVNKLAPQIPVYFISLPFVMAGALVLLYLGIPSLLALFADGFLPTTIAR